MTTDRVTQYIVVGTTNVTSLISGTTASFQFEVITAYVNGVSTAFTWVNGLLTIGSYSSGTVHVDYKLYLISGTLSKYLPKDPTNPASALVFWEDRVMSFPIISTQIKNIDDGLVESDPSLLSFLYRGGWDELATLETFFVNKPVTIYRNGAILYQASTNGSGTNAGVYSVEISKVDSALEKECTFGDPAYLNAIDRSSSNAFYTGSNINEKYAGRTIPMVFGPRTPWEDTESSSIPNGQIILAGPPLTLPPVNSATRKIGTNILIKVIPISSTQGILCRTPSWQTLQSSASSENFPALSPRFWSKVTFDTTNVNVMYGQLIKLTAGVGTARTQQSGRVFDFGSGTSIELSAEDIGTGVGDQEYASFQYDSKAHLCSASKPADTSYNGLVTLTSQNTPNGNRLWKITVSSSVGLNSGEDFYFVCTDVAGSRSAPKVAEFVLDSHGYSTDSTFDTVGTSIGTKATMQVGYDSFMPTINDVLSEINRSCLTMIKKNLNSEVFGISLINNNPTPSVTVTDKEIANVITLEKAGNAYDRIHFEPKYLRGSTIRDDVYVLKSDSTFVDVLDLSKTKVIDHCLDQIASRWDEIAKFWARPEKEVGFILMDESVSINIGDYVQLVHDNFTGIIFVTKISPKIIGFSITGRKIK